MKERIPLYLILLIVGLYVLDQVTKWAVVLNFDYNWALQYSYDVIRVISDNSIVNFNLVRVHNTGVAFGAGNGTVWAPFLFLGIQIIALVWLFILFRKNFFCTRLMKFAWALIMTGIIGNMTDRLLQGFFRPFADKMSFFENLMGGYVVDFLDFSFPWIKTATWPNGYHWPSFNVADSCVCIAAALFMIAAFITPEKKEEASEEKATDTPEKKEEESQQQEA